MRSEGKRQGGFRAYTLLAYRCLSFLFLTAWISAAYSHDDLTNSRRALSVSTSTTEKIHELTTRVSSLLEERCYGCHKNLTGDELFDPMTKEIRSQYWEEVKRRIGLPEQDGGHMPPSSETPLTQPQKDRIKDWIALQGFLTDLGEKKTGPDDLIENKSHSTSSVTDREAHQIMARACGNCHGPIATRQLWTIPLRMFHRTFLKEDGSLDPGHLGMGNLPTTVSLMQADVERGSMPLPESMHSWVNSLMSATADPLPPSDRKKLLTWFKQLQTEKKPKFYSIVWSSPGVPLKGSKQANENTCARFGLHLMSQGQAPQLKSYLESKMKDALPACFWTSGFSGITDPSSGLNPFTWDIKVTHSPNSVWIVDNGRGFLGHRKDSDECAFACVGEAPTR
jgi:hypothetical protein